jgi:two-component system nitrate/nitrite response regulator NarL
VRQIFASLASVSSADDLRPSKATPHLPLYLIVHTGNDFDIALEQIALFQIYARTHALRSLPITIG